MNIEDVIEAIRSDKWAGVIEEGRGTDNDQWYVELKRRKLPAFTPSATFPGERGKYKSFIHSGIVSADLDQGHIEGSQVADVYDAVRALSADPHCVFAFISPSGEGVKAGFHISAGIEDDIDHKRAYHALKIYLGSKGILIDISCSDVSRLCFVSHDPNAYYNGEAERLPWEHISRESIAALVLEGDMWAGEPDYTLVEKFRAEKIEQTELDYGGEVEGDSARDDRAQAIQQVLERKYPKAKTFPWMGHLIEYGDKSDPEVKEPPNDPSLRSNWVMGLATNWFRMGGSPETLHGLFMSDDFEINSVFFREWTPGPRSVGAPRDPDNADRQRRRTIGRAMDTVEKELALVGEKGDVTKQLEQRYPEQREVWEDVIERMGNARKTKGKQPHQIALELLRPGIDTELVTQALLEFYPDKDPGKMISVVRLTKQELDDAAKEQMDSLEFMNAMHFRVRRYGKDSPVVTVKANKWGAETITLQSHARFVESYIDRTMLAHDGEKETTLGDWWLRHPDSRCYDEMVFDPRLEPDSDPNIYNLWRGFPYEPIEGDLSPLEDFLYNVLCSKSQASYDYTWRFMAHIVQYPGNRPDKGLVLQGEKGTGKSFFAETICGGLVGPRHYKLERNPYRKFNADTQNTILMFCDEYESRGTSKEDAELKRLITGQTRSIERKGFDQIDQWNCLHIIIASNDAHVIKADRDTRRFFVLNVSSERKQDTRLLCRARRPFG